MSLLPIFWRRLVLAGWDALAWLLSFAIFVTLRYDLILTQSQWQAVLNYTVSAIVLTLVCAYGFHLYMGRYRVGSFAEASALGVLVAPVSLSLGLVFVVAVPDFPRGVALVLPPLALTFMGLGRWAFRSLFRQDHRRGGRPLPNPTAAKVLVYGAGDDGHDVARLVDHASEPPYQIVGFIDDDLTKRYRRIGSYRVLGQGSDLLDIARQTDADGVILAISAATRELIDRLAEESQAAGLKFITVPPVRERIGGRVRLQELREFNVADLLGRRQIHTDLQAIGDYVAGKVVLVTGAGGSIGSELSRQVHKLGPRKLILLDRDESALHALQLSIYGVGLLDTDDMVLCDIRDKAALAEVFRHHRPEVVFHTAALKHLPMLEMYPLEGWKTNVLGSLNVLQAAHEAGVETLVNISTDKAADPSSVLGQSKRIAERLTSWYAGTYDVRYLSVRFGNVLGSRGSVLYTFRSQIERGGPITVTHPDVTRYFMTIPEACELVLQAGAIGRPRDVLVLDMGEPIRIVDVARRLLEESHRTDVEIEFTGLRHGEKLHEVLFSARENGEPSAHPLINRVSVPEMTPGEARATDPQDGDAIKAVLSRQRLSTQLSPEAGANAVCDSAVYNRG
ncbi:NDP-sugar epimerase, includes UDP-GlcNAc-inverting 4,6-dehydratase FlaA1 and capsular polysaccharide biosynthesis protein EpsC [Raineyella antarctica]|uniref:NDP-sugar epimerase, includes UDP-GlcNAc-inverting 4,6-dehydratase FlaA1 and capsular polysaccharide biosynthesis protein EpsC n=1 Tax=Raineyella antarctica TaxID=1577474 RepID=A0A1G6GEE1_9ACTN|nr:nucleoside-diphosphate sugar epimerase/dehydratase [Raineyella antarctica]SDB80382.1 NDP-sugar epimerase, includes UDP-GlcNAc-inverting 4,6-dehydratase FlaA1 and capsular polysaccharide biosynthesis protein EpsC [Raineyella antarctica]